MKTTEIIKEGIVGVSVELSVAEMIILSDTLSVLKERVNRATTDEYKSSSVTISVEYANMLLTFASKFTHTSLDKQKILVELFGESAVESSMKAK